MPSLLTQLLKPFRKSYFESHQSQMPSQERDRILDELLEMKQKQPDDGTGREETILSLIRNWYEPFWQRRAVRGHETTEEGPSSCALALRLPNNNNALQQRLRVLDVGSCYGPFAGKTLSHYWLGQALAQHLIHASSPSGTQSCVQLPSGVSIVDRGNRDDPINAALLAIPLDVVSMDLGPYEGSSVLQGDWLAVPVRDAVAEEGKLMIPSSDEVGCSSSLSLSSPCVAVGSSWREFLELDATGRRLQGIQHGSAHALIFSLVLSYLPTPQMRFDALVKAHDVLENHGLLVVLSTRTQGSRNKGNWIRDWVTSIESIGFVRVHQTIQSKLVGLSFRKCTREGGTMDETRWNEIRKQMSEKLTILADL